MKSQKYKFWGNGETLFFPFLIVSIKVQQKLNM